MRRLTTFLCGVVAGAALLFLARSYHVIRARDGVHLIPKIDDAFTDTFIDIRRFGLADWRNHGAVFAAISKADRTDLIEIAGQDALTEGLDRLLGPSDRNR